MGVCIFLAAAKYAIRWRREKPKLGDIPTAELEFLAIAESRRLITWASVFLLAVGLGMTLLTERTIAKEISFIAAKNSGDAAAADAKAEGAKADAAPAAAGPTWEVMEANWPSFRGPGSGGTAHFKTAPTDWDIASEKA